MKKTVITLAFLTLSIVSFAVTFDLGIKGGYNTSKLTSDFNSFKPDAQGGFNFGAFGRFGGNHIYLQPELLYVVKNGGFNISNITYAVKTKSVQVPVLLGMKLLNLKVASIRAFTGPAISFVSGYEIDQNLAYNYNKSTWDYQLGAGIDVLMLTFDIRYEWGLSKKFDSSNLGSNFTSKGNTFTVSVGFKFL